jgi:hypothetical protein
MPSICHADRGDIETERLATAGRSDEDVGETVPGDELADGFALFVAEARVEVEHRDRMVPGHVRPIVGALHLGEGDEAPLLVQQLAGRVALPMDRTDGPAAVEAYGAGCRSCCGAEGRDLG